MEQQKRDLEHLGSFGAFVFGTWCVFSLGFVSFRHVRTFSYFWYDICWHEQHAPIGPYISWLSLIRISPHTCKWSGCFCQVLMWFLFIFCSRAPQFHSHQLFHILVVAGAFVHFHGVSNLQELRYTVGAGCTADGALWDRTTPLGGDRALLLLPPPPVTPPPLSPVSLHYRGLNKIFPSVCFPANSFSPPLLPSLIIKKRQHTMRFSGARRWTESEILIYRVVFEICKHTSDFMLFAY